MIFYSIVSILIVTNDERSGDQIIEIFSLREKQYLLLIQHN
jgi:hypothetical protein